MKPYQLVYGLLAFGLTCAAQQPADQPAGQTPEPPRALPSGLRLNSLSGYAEGGFLRSPLLDAGAGTPQIWLFNSGGSGDVALRFGRHTQFSADYRGGYTYNQRYPVLNGSYHNLSLELQTDPLRHTVFAVGATGQSGLISDAVFDPTYALAAASQARSASQLSQQLLEAPPAAAIDSAVELALSGGRRRSGEVHASVRHSHSRRFSTQAQVTVMREIHSYSPDLHAAPLYPNVTLGTASIGFRYLLSTRTRLTGTETYVRSYTPRYQAEWESADIGIQRDFGRRSFGSLQGGYVRISDSHSSGFGRSSYTLAAGYGTMKGGHTLAGTVRRGSGDLHGLASRATIGADGAWSWHSPTSNWTLGSSVSYERLSGASVGLLQAWLTQASVTRRLSNHFELSMTAVYLADLSSNLDELSRAGCRISLVWRPMPEVSR